MGQEAGVTLECAKARCGDDATLIVGGFSLCGDHKGDFMEVAAAFYEGMTVEDLQGIAGAMAPLARSFYEQGIAMAPEPPPPAPGSVQVGIALTYDREVGGGRFVETMALFQVILPMPLDEKDKQDHPVTAEEFGRPRTMSITMPTGQIKIDMTGQMRKLLTPGS
jgi:hypothetical protein